MALPDLEVWQLALFQAPVAQREGLKHLRASAGEAPRRAMLMALPVLGVGFSEHPASACMPCLCLACHVSYCKVLRQQPLLCLQASLTQWSTSTGAIFLI